MPYVASISSLSCPTAGGVSLSLRSLLDQRSGDSLQSRPASVSVLLLSSSQSLRVTGGQPSPGVSSYSLYFRYQTAKATKQASTAPGDCDQIVTVCALRDSWSKWPETGDALVTSMWGVRTLRMIESVLDCDSREAGESDGWGWGWVIPVMMETPPQASGQESPLPAGGHDGVSESRKVGLSFSRHSFTSLGKRRPFSRWV